MRTLFDIRPDEQEPDTEPTSEFQQVLQTAIMGSRGNGHKEVTLLDLLAAISKQRPDFLGKG